MKKLAGSFALVTVAARELLLLIHELTELMELETAYLGARRMADSGALQTRKMALIRRYEELATNLRDCPNRDRDLEASLRHDLHDAMTALRGTMAVNQMTIESAQRLNQRLATVIAEAVREKRSPGGTYGAAGQLASDSYSAPLSVQIDQQL